MAARPLSHRVEFDSGRGHSLAGILDLPGGSDAADHNATQPAGNLVFSHCFTCSKDLKAIVRISRRLAVAGFAVLRFDMSGLGNSGGDFSRTHFSTNLLDLDQAVTWMRSERGDVHGLIGHSFGGIASMVYASRHAGLAAIATIGAPSDTSHLADLLLRMNPAIGRDGAGTVVIGGRTWTIRQAMIDDFREHQAADEIAKLNCPTLILHSTRDGTVSFDHAIRIESLIRGNPRGRVSVIELDPADHLLTRDGDPEYVADCIAAFVGRQLDLSTYNSDIG